MRWVLAILILTLTGSAGAETFPGRPIKLVVPWPPGGSVDITARLIVESLSDRLGVRVFIDNQTGANGAVGMQLAARAAADGYTIVLNTLPLVTNQYTMTNVGYDEARDFVPIGLVGTSPHTLVVPSRMPAKNLAELIALARARPGKLTYSSAGVGTTFHLCGELFKEASGTDILHIPYRGGGPALQDAVGGQVDMSFPILSAALPFVKAGTLRALAVTSTERSALMPDVPTMREGGLKDFQFTQWTALLAPAGTPADRVERLNAALVATLGSKEVLDKFQANALAPFVTTPDEARKFLAGESDRLGKLIKERGITSE